MARATDGFGCGQDSLQESSFNVRNSPQISADFNADKCRWNGKNEAGEEVASGTYFYTIRAGEFVAIRKMVIDK